MNPLDLPLFSYRDSRAPTNLGDTLGPWLISRMYPTRELALTSDMELSPKLLSVGSVVQMAYRPGDWVWGSGIIAANERVAISDPDRILALRGPRTHFLIEGLPADQPIPYGDPALLCPLYHNPPGHVRRYIGLLPHWIDQSVFWPGSSPSDDIALRIDITAPLESVVDDLNQCHTVITTSLHGLVLADAYQVPTIIVERSPTNSVVGGMHKFHDYLEGTGRTATLPGLLPPLNPVTLASIQTRLTLALDHAIGSYQ